MNGMTENCFVFDTNAVLFLTTKGNTISSSIILDAILLTNDDDLLKLSLPGFRVQNVF